MSAQHTPAPWSLYDLREQRPTTARGNPSDKRLMVLHPDRERLICCMNTGFINRSGPIPEDERVANARLIAAAPDLLKALQAMAKIIGPPEEPAWADNDQIEAAWNLTVAAITKATNQHP